MDEHKTIRLVPLDERGLTPGKLASLRQEGIALPGPGKGHYVPFTEGQKPIRKLYNGTVRVTEAGGRYNQATVTFLVSR